MVENERLWPYGFPTSVASKLRKNPSFIDLEHQKICMTSNVETEMPIFEISRNITEMICTFSKAHTVQESSGENGLLRKCHNEIICFFNYQPVFEIHLY
jgi:hypothetical protein